MGSKTKIEWADATWSPVTGCSKVSEGCQNCYAEAVERRFCQTWYGEDWKPWTANNTYHNVRTHGGRLEQPLHWRKPRRIFVCSMGDLFHELVPDDFIVKVFDVMRLNDRHRFQVLTKRAERMFNWVMEYERTEGAPFAIQAPNIQCGVTVESPKYTDRIDWLLQTPAAVRFVSIEPMLGPIRLDAVEWLDWVIVGGESGPKARPMPPRWVRDIRDQCVSAGTPFLFKQWGEWAPDCLCKRRKSHRTIARPGPCSPLSVMFRCGKKAAGRELDGRTWEEVPK